MKAGKLDKFVSVESPVIERSPAGEDLPATWKRYAQRWARIAPISATEQIRNQQVATHTATHIVELRYLPGLHSSHRITWKGRIFEITSVINVDEANREHRLICTEST